MANEGGEWIIYGVDWDDPECLHTVDEAVAYIKTVGFLPLFKNEIPGFSLEERTVPEFWWSGDLERDPWAWREIIARQGEVVYGKFFNKKAGFITKEWLPYFVNYRRDGYDYDAAWEDGILPRRQKIIMDLFEEEERIISFEMKKKAGFSKDGEKNFDGTVTDLMMRTYLCMRNFRKKVNKKGQEYGWDVAVYAKPEELFGYEYVTSAYKEEPKESFERILKHMEEIYPIATKKQITKIIK